MADDLDAFLRQAAERRKARQQERASRPPIAQQIPGNTPTIPRPRGLQPPPLPPEPSIPPSVRTLQPSATQDDVYERSSKNRRTPGDAPSASQNPYKDADSANEFRSLQSQFERPVETPPPAPAVRPPRRKQEAERARKIGDTGPLAQPLNTESLLSSTSSTTSNSSPNSPNVNGSQTNWNNQTIAEQLRNPNSLPLGTILVLGEVLKRPWE